MLTPSQLSARGPLAKLRRSPVMRSSASKQNIQSNCNCARLFRDDSVALPTCNQSSGLHGVPCACRREAQGISREYVNLIVLASGSGFRTAPRRMSAKSIALLGAESRREKASKFAIKRLSHRRIMATKRSYGRSMQKVTRIALPKEQLQKLTAGERSLFLLLGYASNQINTLWKLVVVATNQGTKDPGRGKSIRRSDSDFRATSHRHYARGVEAN